MSVDYVACKWRCAPFVMLILNKQNKQLKGGNFFETQCKLLTTVSFTPILSLKKLPANC